MTVIRSSQLDFDQIKSSLKTYFAQQSEFSDYDFEASGLSNILDVLAYNTHINGLIANYALNESFLSTAQLRSSVVSLAEAVGYTPRSKTAAVAYVNLFITNTSSGRSSSVTLPAYTTFSASVDGVAYTFQTLQPYVAVDNGSGLYQFQTTDGSINIAIYQGSLTTKTFYVGEVGERQIYVVPDVNADTATFDVKVYDTTTGTSFTTYTPLASAITITSTSTYYDVSESPNGFYEINFGDGQSTGLAPVAGNKIVLQYISTAGADANTASSFNATSTVSMDGESYDLNVTTATAAVGGADKESIESIRQNAPINFASQQRLVTALDYEGQIRANYSTVEDVSAWGGADNIPLDYGKVFVSLKFADGVDSDAKVQVQNSIVNNLTNNLSVMSIDTEFVDPEITYIGCTVSFNYNPNLSSTPVNIVEANVLSTVNQYFEDNLNVFGGIFRRSNILSLIDDLSPAILNSRMDVTVQRRFTPTLNVSKAYTLSFPNELQTPTVANVTITSSTFNYQGQICTIRNDFLNASNKLQVLTTEGDIIVDNIGSYNPSNGTISLIGFNPSSLTSGTELKVFAVPANSSTIRPLRNYILSIDQGISSARGLIDYSETRVSL